ncbi:MAG: hypothetical protein HY778_00505 [Betaproteobacteria bacterium]|nr:hypothetical protein [Betaproteobacteria bacterium]
MHTIPPSELRLAATGVIGGILGRRRRADAARAVLRHPWPAAMAGALAVAAATPAARNRR